MVKTSGDTVRSEELTKVGTEVKYNDEVFQIKTFGKDTVRYGSKVGLPIVLWPPF